jgi:hypothetical protein
LLRDLDSISQFAAVILFGPAPTFRRRPSGRWWPTRQRGERTAAGYARTTNPKLTWAIAAIVPFVPFVSVLTGNDFI